MMNDQEYTDLKQRISDDIADSLFDQETIFVALFCLVIFVPWTLAIIIPGLIFYWIGNAVNRRFKRETNRRRSLGYDR